MIPDGLITYSNTDLERKSLEVFRRRPDVPFEARVNLELLVELEKDVRLTIVDGLIAKWGIEGAVGINFMSPTRFVLVDSLMLSRHWPEYASVLAEEYSHIVLHPALIQQVHEVEDFVDLQSDPQWGRFEADAKHFALCLRMPFKLVQFELAHAYAEIVKEHGFGSVERIEKLTRNALALRFRVSARDIQRRLLAM